MSSTSINWQSLLDAARICAEHAYAPYSKFRVGAALQFDDGSVSTGCNVENSSYGLTSCAERNALFTAIAAKGSGRRIAAIAVVNLNNTAGPPCGACRQVMSEFVAKDAMICFPGNSGLEARPFAELFPDGFHLNEQ
jgi:cytidine deaminase